MIRSIFFPLAFIGVSFFWISCSEPQPNEKCMEVIATAYNSTPAQTRPGTAGNITAWGDTLKDGMLSVAISRDLLDSGFVHGSLITIEGYEGDTFVVNDKMNARYTNRIDMYLGTNVDSARQFGKQKLRICLQLPPEE